MNKIVDRHQVNMMMLLISVAYMVSYLTRINYGAVISEMVQSTGIGKVNLSAAVTGSFITYGAGQVVSGFFGDKIQPKTLVFCGLAVTVTMNLLIPFCTGWEQMTVVWCINGFAQAFMWPPIVKLMASLFNGEDYNRACVIASWGSTAGTIVIYLVAPLIISFMGWKGMFFCSAACGIIIMIFWQWRCCKIDNVESPKVKAESEGKSSGGFFSVMLVFVMIAIVLHGALRDGVTTWMPTLVSESFGLSSQISILTGVIMPVFGVVCFYVAMAIYKRMPKNPILCAGIIFAVGVLSSLVLCFAVEKNVVLTILLSALLTGSMHGVNLMLICMLPKYFEKTGKISLISGILNSCVYIGSAISTYGVAYVSEIFGWSTTIILWFVIAAAGALICFLCVPSWKKFVKKQEEE